MTKKRLILNILAFSIFYLSVLMVGLVIYFSDASETRRYYAVFKDVFPIIMTFPLAYLGFCFQRRSNFQISLRLLWANIIHAVNEAILYTKHRNEPEKEYLKVLLDLSKSIDEVRGVYYNVRKSKTDKGLYPFESLKIIYGIIEELGPGELTTEQMKEANLRIKDHWQTIRKTFLAEFDRSEPTYRDTADMYDDQDGA
ncbi:MAG TPA: hypothetical protein VFG10_16290 [Saprospiraceae bacterium]|nr:hypothetical protein [Saprospiraceae bacterium]